MRDYYKFYTPNHIAKCMVVLAQIQDKMMILEPHAGAGNIVMAIRQSINLNNFTKCRIHTVEIDESLETVLYDRGADTASIGDYLKMSISLSPGYDRIIANPPFGNGIDYLAHFEKMTNDLAPKGKLVAIAPREGIVKLGNTIHIPIDNWATNSDGTKTDIQILIYEKP